MNKYIKKCILFFLPVLFLVLLIPPVHALAESYSILLKNGEEAERTLSIGDTGTFLPDYTESGILVTRWSYHCSDTSVLSVDGTGHFTALAPGTAYVTISGYKDTVYGDNYSEDYYSENCYSENYYDSYEVFEAECEITVYPDMSNVTLDKTTVTGYMMEYDYDCDLSVKINGNTSTPLSSDNSSFSYESSNRDMSVYCDLSDNTIYLSCYEPGTTNLSITINGKTFSLKVTVSRLKINASSVLLAKKQTKQLKVSKTSGKITWKSSDPKIASVSSNGLVKGKKVGNVIITAKIGDKKLGCVVSVTTEKVKKAIAKAKKIGATCQYSQPKRMSAGYYDCSSLVWKAYSNNGTNLGSSSYAPTSRDQAKWCKAHNRMIKGGFSGKNLQNLSLLPGDLMFESNDQKNRYSSIYHVEMFAGYEFQGFDSNGKPIVGSLWANRVPNCYYPDGQLMGRPAL
ncbi:MAG: Ig-like domain-containing protein [Clostridiales bacterium]|nr:Ig-like domain-containing protein [Clostridiales bacterium]